MQVTIECDRTAYTTQLDFKLKPFLGGSMNVMNGQVRIFIYFPFLPFCWLNRSFTDLISPIVPFRSSSARRLSLRSTGTGMDSSRTKTSKTDQRWRPPPPPPYPPLSLLAQYPRITVNTVPTVPIYPLAYPSLPPPFWQISHLSSF